MYSFKIEANSMEELNRKLSEFAFGFTVGQKVTDNILSQALNDTESKAVVESIQHATTATVPHLYQNPMPTMEAIQKLEEQFTPVNNKDELDVRGLPWDVRIHSAGRSKNQDNTWRYKRGIDDSIIEQVEKEISTIKSVATPLSDLIPPVPSSPAPAVMPSFTVPPATETVQVGPIVTAPFHTPAVEALVQHVTLTPPDQTQAIPVQDTQKSWSPALDTLNKAFDNVDKGITIPPGMKPAHTLVTFTNNLTNILAQLINEKKINKEYIESLCKHFNVKYIWNVIGDGAQIRELYEAFAQYGFITKLD